MIAARSQVRSTSSNIWEDIKMVFPFFFSERISSTNRFCISGSSPLVGSSRIRILARGFIKAQTMPIFCFMPFDIFFSLPDAFNSNIFISSCARPISLIFFIFATKRINSIPVMESIKAISPGRYPSDVWILSDSLKQSISKMDRLPLSGFINPIS